MIIFTFHGTAGQYLQKYHNLSPFFVASKRESIMDIWERIDMATKELKRLIDEPIWPVT